LQKLGISEADYVISGIPFSYLEPKKKKEILRAVHEGLTPDGQFIVYQVTPELKAHTKMFAAHEVEYFLASIPPMFIVACHKSETTVQPKKRAKKKSTPQHRRAAHA
jgi:phospholipid N-methyltransferase